MKKNPSRRGYPEIEFGGFSDVDGTVRFFSRVSALLTPDAVVVDFGCGRGAQTEDPVAYRRDISNFRGRVRKVVGIDVDRAGAGNSTIDEFRHLLPDGIWPIESSTVDVVLSSFVMEHLPDPELFFSEAARVLRRGGYVCLRTPNVWGYVAVAARMIPERLHKKVLKRVQPKRLDEDIFPTLYRCNSLWKLRRQLSKHGFDGLAYGYEAEPSYLNFSSVAYRMGVWIHKFLPGPVRSAIFAFGRKQ
ncbi:MAG: methyltransferase domain-containing protein [Bryobacteraceae bacterium]